MTPSTESLKWNAVERRDRNADGTIFCSVRTTGVYCKPSCAGRPKRENVAFHTTAADAERAGFSAEPCDFGAVRQHRLLRHANEQIVIVDRRPQRGPNRKGRNIGFGESDQFGAGAGRLADDGNRLFGCGLAIEKDGRGVDGGRLEAGKHG